MKTLLTTAMMFALVIGFVGNTYAAKKEKALKGTFVSLADDKKSITISSGKKGEAKESTVTVDDSTKVTVDGAEAKITDLKAGQKLTITPATGTAMTIEATAGGKKPK